MKRTCIRGTAKERLAHYTTVDPKTGCHVWHGALQGRGYGQATDDNGRGIGAHRLAYQEFVGPIPKGLSVCHTCDNRACTNPKHLFLGTPLDNTLDAKAKERHPHGETHGCARLRAEDVRVIRKSSLTQVELAKLFGVRQAHISRIICRQSWAHV